MYTYSPSLSDLHDLCINYIDNTPENKISEKVYDCCMNYLRDTETKLEKNFLINHFNIK